VGRFSAGSIQIDFYNLLHLLQHTSTDLVPASHSSITPHALVLLLKTPHQKNAAHSLVVDPHLSFLVAIVVHVIGTFILHKPHMLFSISSCLELKGL
jgi:hypothetical protein